MMAITASTRVAPAPAPSAASAEPSVAQAMKAIIDNAVYIAKATDQNDPAFNNVVAWFACGDILDAAAPWMSKAPNFRSDYERCCIILNEHYPFIDCEVCRR